MAQEPSISSSHETLESPPITSSDSNSNNQSLTRNVSFSRLNAKAPEFVPRTTAAVASVVSPPPSVISPGAGDLIHVYPPPSPNPTFHVPIPVNVPVAVPVNVQNHHHHGHHNHNHHGHGQHHGQHYVPIQYHHHNQNHNHHRQFNGGGGGGTGFIDQKEVMAQAQPELKDGLTDEATQKIVNQYIVA